MDSALRPRFLRLALHHYLPTDGGCSLERDRLLVLRHLHRRSLKSRYLPLNFRQC